MFRLKQINFWLVQIYVSSQFLAWHKYNSLPATIINVLCTLKYCKYIYARLTWKFCLQGLVFSVWNIIWIITSNLHHGSTKQHLGYHFLEQAGQGIQSNHSFFDKITTFDWKDMLDNNKLSNIVHYANMYGVPFYFLFPIYGYPKFIFGYP